MDRWMDRQMDGWKYKSIIDGQMDGQTDDGWKYKV